MVQGKVTDTDRAIISRSDGAVTLLTAIEGNEKAWNSVKEAAGRELRSAPQMQNDRDSGVRYKISYTTENEPVVVIENDILNGVDKSDWVKTAKEEIKKFRPAIPISGRFVRVTKDTGREYTNSGYSKKIRSKDEARYRDKLTAAGNLDEIVIASTKYVNEGLNHPRTDDIKDFARGNVLLQVGDRKYSAEVVIGLKMDESMVLHDIVNITDNDFDVKKETNPKPSTSENRASSRQDSSPKTRVPQNDNSVNSYSMQDGELYSQGKKLSIPEKVRQANNIILDENSSEFRNKDAKGYKVVETLAKDLKKKVKFVKGLTDADGNQLDGAITEDGIYINTEGENPVRWAATHEFSHAMKQSATESWSRYQNYVVSQMKRNGSYESVFVAKAKAYGTADANYINEEIAADYIGDLFSDVDSLADFIRESRRDAVTIRDMWYSILDKLGLLDEKKKAQLMWRDAYREAVLNVKDGKVENKGKSEPRFSIQRIVGQNGDYGIGVYLDSNILTGKSESERVIAVKNYVKSIGGREFIAYDNKDNPVPVIVAKYTQKYVNKNGSKTRVNNDLMGYLKNEVKQEATVLIDELVATAKYSNSEKAKYPHGWVDNNGKNDWDYWKVIIQEKNKTVWEATLNIANTTNGEKILYDIYPIEMVEGAETSATTTTNKNIPQTSDGVKGENKKSISGTRLSEVDNSPVGESVDSSSEETSQKFIKPGAEPRRDVKVPESVKEGTKVRQFARTAAEAETLTDETAEGVLQNVEEGKFNYTPISDKSAMSNAYASLDAMGVEWVEKKVSGAIASHSLDKKTVAMAEVLMQRYSEEGQHEKVQKLIVDFAAESTRTAQSLQAISMLKKLDPNYEVSYIDKVVENLREEIIEKNNKKKFGKKHSADIEVSEELKTKLMETKTEEEREAVRDEIYTEIAEQLPDSWIDKWNAWRYMAMLGNARTHVRNVAGNTAFMPMIASR